MAQNKTTETNASVPAFLKTIADEKKRSDCKTIIDLIAKSTGYPPKMWGTAIVGFGSYHYKYDSGREGDAPLAGLAARASSIVLYLGSSFNKREELLAKFGKYKMSGGCIHIKNLEDIDTKVLITMFKNSIEQRKKDHKC